jgi:hypothetical protein
VLQSLLDIFIIIIEDFFSSKKPRRFGFKMMFQRQQLRGEEIPFAAVNMNMHAYSKQLLLPYSYCTCA